MINKFKMIIENFKYSICISFKASIFYTIFRVLARVFLPLLSLVKIYLFKIILDCIAYNSTSKLDNRITICFIGVFLLSVLEHILSKTVSYIEVVHQDIIEQYVQEELMNKAINADIALYDNPKYYDRLNSATTDSYSFSNVVWSLFECISSAITFITTLIIVFRFNVLYASIITICAIPASIISYKYTKSLYHLELSQIKKLREKNYYFELATTKEYIQEIHLYRIEDYIKQYYHNIWLKLHINKKLLIKKKALISSIFELVPVLFVLLFTVSLSASAIKKTISIGDYSLYSNLLQQLLSAISMFIVGISSVVDNILRLENVRKFQCIPNKIIDSGKSELKEIFAIEFKNVSFIYPGSNIKALDGISFVINKGEKIAIVGENGSGKSTIMKLLLRLYEPISGEILINEKNIKSYTISSLRSAFSCYYQNALNYAFTIKNNIVISDLKHQDNRTKIENALYISGCNSFIMKHCCGINNYVTRLFNDNGLELSGGENQKLALARTIFRDSKILLLDEPTSALDPSAEEDFLNQLKKQNEKTIIITSHKLSNIIIADRIILMKNGKIVESGKKDTLINNDSKFRKLYAFQFNAKENSV